MFFLQLIIRELFISSKRDRFYTSCLCMSIYVRSFVYNVIKFFVWLILLGVCFLYLQSHPAEKVSMVSSLEILRNKALFFVSKLQWVDVDLMKSRTEIQKSYEELFSTAERYNCLTGDDSQDFLLTIKSLSNEPLSEFKKKEGQYITIGYKYKKIINENCYFKD